MYSLTFRPTALAAAVLLAFAASSLTTSTAFAAPASPVGPGDLAAATPGPDDPSPPVDPEPQVPNGPGDLVSCQGYDAEGQVVDLCDHPTEEPTEEPTPQPEPKDPCSDTPTTDSPLTSVQIPAPGGSPLTLTAEPAECEPPAETPPSFTG